MIYTFFCAGAKKATCAYARDTKKVVLLAFVLVLLSTAMVVAFIKPVVSKGTIYIRADGSVEGTTLISSVDNVTYTFTDNIYDEIVVERDNIVVDGAGCTLQGTGIGTGIDLDGRSNVTIKNMEIKAFSYGIYLYDSSNNTISGNNITNNNYGILLLHSSNNILRNNVMVNNSRNFGVWGDELEEFVNDVDGSNTVNGKPVYYWTSTENAEVPLDAGYVVLVDCTNIRVENLTLKNNFQGVLLACTHNSTISGNNITNNYWDGIDLYNSSNNTISVNNLTANNWAGIWLEESSNNNSISGNNITNNYYGIWLNSSSSNIIYHNNFVDNTEQVHSLNSKNVWDDGYPSGGNYWSDYIDIDQYSGPHQNETGSDGIWDHPYVMDENNQDNYPMFRRANIDVVLVIDRSGSMAWYGDVIHHSSITLTPDWSKIDTFDIDSSVTTFDVILETGSEEEDYLRIKSPSGKWYGYDYTPSLPLDYTHDTYINYLGADYIAIYNSSNVEQGTWEVHANGTSGINYYLAVQVPPVRINAAKDAAKYLMDLMSDGDQLGLVSFAATASLDRQLTLLDTKENRDSIRSAIDSLIATGATAMGDGIHVAKEELTSERHRLGAIPAMVLFTDGMWTSGSNPIQRANEAEDAGIKIYVIGLGRVDHSILIEIKNITGGDYLYAPSASELKSMYQSMIAAAKGWSTVVSARGTVKQDEINEQEVMIDSTVSEAFFSVDWTIGDLNLTLIRPDGSLIDPAVAEIDPDIRYVSAATYEIYDVKSPMPGTWTMVVTGVNVTLEEESFIVQVTALTTVTLTLATDKDSYTYPEPVKIMVTLKDMGNPLTGADVETIVTRSDASQISITLFDDGLDAHGDINANDGVYTNYFTQYSENGSYTLKAIAVGTTLIGENFSREAKKTILVSGVPLDKTPPTSSFTYSPLAPYTGETVIFNASASYDPDGDIVSYKWDFDDGNITTVSHPVVAHTYTAAGTYVVNLTIIDNDGLTGTTIEYILVNTLIRSIDDPIGDVSAGFVDIVKGSVLSNGTHLTVIIKLKDLPHQLYFDSPETPDNYLEYQWALYIDVDGDPSTGSPSYKGSEVCISIMNFKSPGSLPKNGTIIDETQQNIWIYNSTTGSWRSEAYVITIEDFSTNSLIMFAPLQLIPWKDSLESSNLLFIASYYHDGRDSAYSLTMNNPPYQPQLSITPSPNVEDNDDLIVTVTGPTPADPDGDAVTYTYRWLVDVGTGEFLDDELAGRGDHTGNTVPAADTVVDDIWRVEVTPVDEHGAVGLSAIATWQPVVVPDATKPVADAGPDQTVNEDTLVTFDASGSTDNVGIINYTWTFIDITPQTLKGINPTYNFTSPGTYIVTLTVEDAAGNNATDAVTITVLLDTDGDGTPDVTDPDDDNDGVNDDEDAFPLDPTEWVDTDGDGIGNNADTDDDNDGVLDVNDAFPLDPTESMDTDGDGVGDNADTDDDNDGVPDVDDAFPLDASESVDTDRDDVGNNADTDDDNDGIPDVWEIDNGLDPLDAQDASLDPDNDGLTSFQEYLEDKDPNVYDAEVTREPRSLYIVAEVAVVGVVVTAATAALASLGGLGQSFNSAVSKLPIPDELKDFLKLYGEEIFETVDKIKLETLEKAPFITKGELAALGISALITTIVFGFVETNGFPHFLNQSVLAAVIPSTLLSVCIVSIAGVLSEALCARTCRVCRQFRLWMYGIGAFLISGLLFLFPFASPGITRYQCGEISDKTKGLIVLSKMLILLTLTIPFAGLFMLGFKIIGDAGLLLTLMTVCYSLVPLKPLAGKAVFDYRKEVSLIALVSTGILFFSYTFNLLPHVTYLAVGVVSVFLAAITLIQLREAHPK